MGERMQTREPRYSLFEWKTAILAMGGGIEGLDSADACRNWVRENPLVSADRAFAIMARVRQAAVALAENAGPGPQGATATGETGADPSEQERVSAEQRSISSAVHPPAPVPMAAATDSGMPPRVQDGTQTEEDPASETVAPGNIRRPAVSLQGPHIAADQRGSAPVVASVAGATALPQYMTGGAGESLGVPTGGVAVGPGPSSAVSGASQPLGLMFDRLAQQIGGPPPGDPLVADLLAQARGLSCDPESVRRVLEAPEALKQPELLRLFREQQARLHQELLKMQAQGLPTLSSLPPNPAHTQVLAASSNTLWAQLRLLVDDLEADLALDPHVLLLKTRGAFTRAEAQACDQERLESVVLLLQMRALVNAQQILDKSASEVSMVPFGATSVRAQAQHAAVAAQFGRALVAAPQEQSTRLRVLQHELAEDTKMRTSMQQPQVRTGGGRGRGVRAFPFQQRAPAGRGRGRGRGRGFGGQARAPNSGGAAR